MAISIDNMLNGEEIAYCADKYIEAVTKECFSDELKQSLVEAGNKVGIGSDLGMVVDYSNGVSLSYIKTHVRSMRDAIEFQHNMMQKSEEEKVHRHK